MTKSQSGTSQHFDALVIGSGLAGLSYCLYLSKLNPKARIALVTKTTVEECNSRYAQGGIAAVHSKDDSFNLHTKDTLQAGSALCNSNTVKIIIENGPQIITELLELGVPFERKKNHYSLAQEGGHSKRRIFYCADTTGNAIMQQLLITIRKNKQIHLFETHIAVNLISESDSLTPNDYGEVFGAYILDERKQKIHTFTANCTLLATGGAGKTYRYTTNSMIATGDGLAMAYRAGCRISNMEFYQFHPTILYHHRLNHFLISEALRGEGALLKDAISLQRFMPKYAPNQKELATRDIVARAIFSEIEKTHADFVYLDITHKTKYFLQKRFPSIYQHLKEVGIDISEDLIPVVPAAHYQCGGILASTEGQTDLKRLYAIGEVACTGLHGANRLASNSLLEAMVMAKLAAKSSIEQYLSHTIKPKRTIYAWQSGNATNPRRASQINAHWRGLRGEMTSYAGIVRTEAGLQDLLELITMRKKIIEDYYWQHEITRDFIELRNIVLTAELIVRSALNRRESRGGHFREDYPKTKKTAANSINSIYHPFV